MTENSVAYISNLSSGSSWGTLELNLGALLSIGVAVFTSDPRVEFDFGSVRSGSTEIISKESSSMSGNVVSGQELELSHILMGVRERIENNLVVLDENAERALYENVGELYI